MTTYTCPEGHASSDPDYCDICGAPIGASAPAAAASSGAASAASAAGAAGSSGAAGGGGALDLDAPAPDGGTATATETEAPRTCPNCGEESAAGALFCEDCGYDFTTGAMPAPPDVPDAVPDAAPDGVPDAPDTPAAGTPASAASASSSAPAPVPAAPAAAPEVGAVAEWVAELWVDPDWYALQGAQEPCPSAGPPDIVPLAGRSLLIGRHSASRNIHPDVDCSADTGVSRRHAQLTTDGQRWWVEDLQSANGTFVGSTGDPLPDAPIEPGNRRELADDDRLYLGAWTRIVIRRATPEEMAPGGA
jgi:FHA domain